MRKGKGYLINMEMPDIDSLVKSEIPIITSDSPIPNLYNTSLVSDLIKTEIQDVPVKQLAHIGSLSVFPKTEPTDNALSEGQHFETEMSEPSLNRTLHDPNKQIFLKKEEETVSMQNHIYNTSLESGLIKTEMQQICVNDLALNRFSIFTKTESADSTLSEGQLINTEMSVPTLNRTPNKQIHTEEEGEQTVLVKNLRILTSVNQMEDSPSRGTAADKTFVCDACGRSFSKLSLLVRHKRCHTGEKPFVCDLCGKRYSLAGDLGRHKRTHTGEMPFVCDVCDKQFSRSSHLVRHKRWHSGEKPFVCDVCDKRFAQASGLVVHKRFHNGERPFDCNVCYKQFSTNYHLVIHMRSHTGERPFVCDLCHKKFSTPSNLVRHKRSHTGEKAAYL